MGWYLCPRSLRITWGFFNLDPGFPSCWVLVTTSDNNFWNCSSIEPETFRLGFQPGFGCKSTLRGDSNLSMWVLEKGFSRVEICMKRMLER